MFFFPLWKNGYQIALAVLAPVNVVLVTVLRGRARPRSVLHICYMNHVPHNWVTILRQHGIDAAYLAVGNSPLWNKCDYQYVAGPVPALEAFREFWMFWRIVAHYQVVHLHFMQTFTRSEWDLPIMKRLGRRIVVYWAGCEVRNRERNMALHPDMNICQVCDYNATICRSSASQRRRELARRWGDITLISTPDLADFAPEGHHFPFFAPPSLPVHTIDQPRYPERPIFKIVHATAHPGIEGSVQIEAAIDRLRQEGWPIEYQYLHLVPHERILAALADADLAIGKMKMGYYANFQIEAMAMGVPAITYVRPEFMTDELRKSGFVFSDLAGLEAALRTLLQTPEDLTRRRKIARASILSLHDDQALVHQLTRYYGWTDMNSADVPDAAEQKMKR